MHNVFMTSGIFRPIFGYCTCDAAGVEELYFDKLFEAEEHGFVFSVRHCPWQVCSKMRFSFWRRIKFMKHDFSFSIDHGSIRIIWLVSIIGLERFKKSKR
jgi:hypothetical protein